MSMETKALSSLELKWSDQTPGAFEGIAAAFGNVDLGGDVIEPGAFQASLVEHKAAGTRPALLWQHDQAQPIGVIDALDETPAGLAIKGRLAVDTQKGSEAYALAKMGALDGLSIGYRAKKATRDARGIRKITAADLAEVSMVTLPMNTRARISSIKAAGAAKGKSMTDNLDDAAAAGNADMEAKLAALEEKAAKIDRIDEIETELKAAQKRADDLELKLSRPGLITSKDVRGDLQKKAFSTFLRHGREALDHLEAKSLVASDDTRGGFLAPADFSAEVDRSIVQFSPVRQAARVGSTASGSVLIPRRTSAPTAAWVGETDARAEAAPAYGQVEIPISEIACYVDVSTKLLEDGAVNVEAEVAFDLAEEFGRIEGEAFISGNAVKKPEGLLHNSDISSTNSGSASAITADAMITLMYALAPFYRQRGVWMMNGSTLAAVRKLKDNQGQYLWQPGLAAGQPETLLGRPVIEAVDMPNVAAGTYPIMFGDVASAYRIYDRVSVSILRDPYSVATSGLVRFHARRRVGGGVVRAEAVRKLYIAA